MWRLRLIVHFYLVAIVTSEDINVVCQEDYGFPSSSNHSPSQLADLKLELVNVLGIDMVNVSWAINIDASIKYLDGTRIDAGAVHLCKYIPSFAESNLTGIQQKWFHYLLNERYGSLIQAANIPLPPDGTNTFPYKYAIVMTTRTTRNLSSKPLKFHSVEATATGNPLTGPKHKLTSVLMNVYLGLAAVMLLTSGYLIYKRCGRKWATSLGFQMLQSTSVEVPIHVLMVYPPENGIFQKAVVALAEFLQKHAGCSVAIDVWQQNKIARDGPMRWLAEQVRVAKHVFIICPMSRHPPTIHNFTSTTEPSIPAAAQDLYPLILNVVASHAKNSRELAKFWVLQLCEKQKNSDNLPPELMACKVFCLLKDLNKLCGSLHTRERDGQRFALFKPASINSRKSTVKLKDSLEKLNQILLYSREGGLHRSEVITV
ncbi:uncharacterized protein il17rb [Stigmatopora argus]